MDVVASTILEGPCRMPFYTDLQSVFRAFGGREKEFDWLVTDLDCDSFPPEFQPMNSSWVLSGRTLSDVVMRQTTPIQFNWGVFSGFRGGAKVDLARLEVQPYADGNPTFWSGRPGIQYPGAAAEIVCWDGRATLLLTTDADLTRKFRAYFPEARDLEERNLAQLSDSPDPG
jgi:hypothetical protein